MPQRCVLCTAASGDTAVCTACRRDLPWLPALQCPRCALPTGDGSVCGQCLRHPPAFDRTYCRLAYEFPLDKLIQRFKYGHQLGLAAPLGQLLRAGIPAGEAPALILPVPLHPQRLSERGFNQVLEMLRPWADRRALRAGLLTRTRPGQHQADLPWQQRARNVKGMFACDAAVAGQRVVLVDDVMTTGATLNELARQLKKAGALQVDCWVLARALPHR